MLDRRRLLAERYDELLADLDWLRTPKVAPGYVHGYQSYVCLFSPKAPTTGNVEELTNLRNAVMARLESSGIATRQGTHAAHLQGYYRERYGLRSEDFPNAYFSDRLSLSLPLYAQMTDEEQATVVQELKAAFAELPART